MSDDSVLTVDASGVEVFDFSFASELFGKLVLGVPAEFPGRYVVVTGLSDYLRENLDAALKSIGVMMLEIQSRRRWNLLGKQSPSDRETLVSLNEFGRSVSATELAEELKINLTASNERLAKLSRMGLVRRREGGRGRSQYSYSFLL